MNRQQRKALEKQMGKEAVEKVNLLLNIPEECLTCHKKFDKKNREMAMTWHVEVFNKDKKVNLYCPECQEKRIK